MKISKKFILPLLFFLAFSCMTREPEIGKDENLTDENRNPVLFNGMSARELYQAAISLVKEKSFIQAVEMLIEAREKEPENASYAVYLGWLYIQHLQDAEKAVIHLEDARRFDPDKQFLWSNLARTYRALERWEEAGEAYQLALKDKEPDSSGANLYAFEAGRMYFKAGRVDEGVVLMRDAWLNPSEDNRKYIYSKYADILYLKARQELTLENYSEALKYFSFLDEYVSADPSDDTYVLNPFCLLFLFNKLSGSYQQASGIRSFGE